MEYAVLFVCTGNICRSPTAHGVFRHYVEKAGLADRCYVDSAGTHGYHVGDAPDKRSIDVARAGGVALDDLRARKFTVRDFSTFDLILAMDQGHYSDMERMRPQKECRAELALFTDFVSGSSGQDVPDPYYGGLSGFNDVYDLIAQGSEELLSHVQNLLGSDVLR